MKIGFWVLGKTNLEYAKQGIQLYLKRIQKFHPIAYEELPVPKSKANLSPEMVKNKEAEVVLKKCSDQDILILLDEKGEIFDSRGFSRFIEKTMGQPGQRVIFIAGGPYGFDPGLYQKAEKTISLSALTFPHDLARVIFLEQLYRGFTLLNGVSYHHD